MKVISMNQEDEMQAVHGRLEKARHEYRDFESDGPASKIFNLSQRV
jgi:hypothetical protein